jgi:hypothetical protein
MKANAANRGLAWNLDDLDVIRICASDCDYCGAPPSNKASSPSGLSGDYVYNGIDRVDSTRGYEPDNVVPCCFVCNNAKRTMTASDFAEWIECVYTRLLVKSHQSKSGAKS